MPCAVWADNPTELNLSNLSTYTETSGGMLKLQSGSYKLASDITIDKTLKIEGEVILDLNGYVLSLAKGSKGSVIKVCTNGALTVQDSNRTASHYFDKSNAVWTLATENTAPENKVEVKGGVITGGNAIKNDESDGKGGGIRVFGALNLYGGNIVGCQAASKGGAIYAQDDGVKTGSCNVTISDGTIFGCGAYSDLVIHASVAKGEVKISGGKCDGRIFIDASSFAMSGGEVSSLSIEINSSGNRSITGGTIGSCQISDTNTQISGGTFNGKVTNYGTISGGTFNGKVTNYGTISGGIFYSDVENSNDSNGHTGTINELTVAYKLNGEDYAKQVLQSGNTATRLTPRGYSNFGDWYTDADCKQPYNFSTGVTGHTMLYTTGTPTEYTITYNLDGGSIENGANPTSYTVKSNDITLNAPTRTGYIFTDWSGTDITSPSKNVTIEEGSIGNREYTANWTECTEHQYSSSKDTTCDLCGHVRTIYYSITQRPAVIAPEHGKIILSYNGRTATVTPDEGYEIESVMVNGVDKGKVTEITGLKTGDKVEVTFKKTKATLDAEVRNMVAGLGDFKARSSRVNSKIKVALDMSDIDKETLAAIAELGYTVKYRYYRSTKKLSGYRAMRTGTTGVYYNTIGKAGKRYYYKGQIRVYDSDGNLVDRTALKDCRYASRRF